MHHPNSQGPQMSKLENFLKELLEKQEKQTKLLEKICALLVSQQLLDEVISPEGEVREPEECAIIVQDSFVAGMCISEELKEKVQQFEYHKAEFFVDNEEDEVDDKPEPPSPMEFSQ